MRPNKEDYYIDISDYQNTHIGKYVTDLETYCDELEKALDKASYQLMRFAECDRCPMKEDHCMITNWQCKDKWKEWCLKDE